MIRLYLWFCRVLFLLHASHGCGGHPAFPAPSFDFEGETKAIARTPSAPRESGRTLCIALQFSTRLPSGLSSEKVGTSISNRSPLSLTIW
jgi:hypothetical protein